MVVRSVPLKGTRRTKKKVCINADTPAHRNRPANHPGPRCATCSRPVRSKASDARHGSYVLKTYELTGDEYARILADQGGKCAICPRPLTSTKRRYAVDHDHADEKLSGVRHSIRGLLCKRHNNLLRDVRDDVDTLKRAIEYLENPPAWKVTRNANTPA